MNFAQLNAVLLRKFENVDNARRWHESLHQAGGYASDKVALASYRAQLLMVQWEIDALAYALEQERDKNSRRSSPRFWDLQVALERAIVVFERKSKRYQAWREDQKPGDAECRAEADGVVYQAKWLLGEVRIAISEERRLPKVRKPPSKPIELQPASEIEKNLVAVGK